jgi:hypothetical protein
VSGLAWLFILGGALELFGLYLVGRDVLDSHIKNTTPVTPAQVNESLGEKMVEQVHSRGCDQQGRWWQHSSPRMGRRLFAAGVMFRRSATIIAL